MVRIDRDALQRGIEQALELESVADVSFVPLNKGIEKVVLRVNFKGSKTGYGRRAAHTGVVKWYLGEPSKDEPVRYDANRTDAAFMREVRSLEAWGKLSNNLFIPSLEGYSVPHKLIVSEDVPGMGINRNTKNRHGRVLGNAKKFGYSGLGKREIPNGVLIEFLKASTFLGNFSGISSSYSDFFDSESRYGVEAIERYENWVDLTRERLGRIHGYKHGEVEEAAKLFEKVDELHLLSEYFGEPVEYNHGDFNFFQFISNRVFDFEDFGKYQTGKDLASLCVVVGFDDSSGILRSESFPRIVDQYILSKSLAIKAVDSHDGHKFPRKDVVVALHSAYTSIRKVGDSDKHVSAIKILGEEENYADFTLNLYFHALNELVRLGAVYDRNRRYSEDSNMYANEENGFGKKMLSVFRGIENLLAYVIEEREDLFERATYTEEKKEFFVCYKNLLESADILLKL